MPLAPGDKLGPYEILAPLGAGGMGEVYRARDTRLHRDVAIKVSQEKFSDRFEREARSIAALNHPNICHLYDVGPNYLVMELIDGAPVKGPLPLETALDYAKQIANALEAAHERGIIHRDLKPANILVTPSGVIKVLDFGLAKTADAPAGDPQDSPTQTISPTGVGMILGTAAYMAPEQARGKPVDKRADIWAFGVVLYEMLTGKRLFRGKAVPDILAAVLNSEPDLTGVPVQVRRLLNSCLEKDPRQRLHDVGDAKLLLEEAPAETASPVRRSWLGWTAAALLLVLASPLAFIHFRETPPETPVLRATILPPENTSFHLYGGLGAIAPPALSPDGRRMVFGARGKDGRSKLWVRQLDALTGQPLAGTDGAIDPFWSPDSKFVGFFADGKLKKIDASGGPPFSLCDVVSARGGTWNESGLILFASSAGAAPLQHVSASGGNPVALPAQLGRWPNFLPDGRHFLFLSEKGITLGALDSQESKLLVDLQSDAVYSQGHLLYLREEALMAQPFDLKKLAFSGEAVPVVDQVRSVGTVRRGIFSVSQNGLLTYQSGANDTRLAWFGRDGQKLGELGEPGQFRRFQLSPDGRTAAVVVLMNQVSDLWLYDTTGGLRTRFTFSNSRGPMDMAWSPDRSSIAFSGQRDGKDGMFRKAANMSGSEELLMDGSVQPLAWSSDGKHILYTLAGETSKLFALPLFGDRKRMPFAEGAVNPISAEFSPDGRWICYTAQESGRSNIFIAPFPGPGGTIQVATGFAPRWRRGGKELFFLSQGGIFGTELTVNGGAIQVGRIQPLVRAGTITGTFDATPDGQRFLVAVPVAETGAEPLSLVHNWTAGLKK